MPYFAKLDSNNIVTYVTIGKDDDDGKENELSQRTGDVYKQTSYNTFEGKHLLGGTPFRKNFASVGYFYDESRDAFIPPKIYDNWILDEETCSWVPPIKYPDDGKMYSWDFKNDTWKEIPQPVI